MQIARYSVVLWMIDIVVMKVVVDLQYNSLGQASAKNRAPVKPALGKINRSVQCFVH